jgi:hypothetical protein
MRRTAGARDDHPQAAGRRRPGVLVHGVGRAVGRDDPHLVRDTEVVEDIDRALHDRQIRVAPHDDTNERLAHVVTVAVRLQRWAVCEHD